MKKMSSVSMLREAVRGIVQEVVDEDEAGDLTAIELSSDEFQRRFPAVYDDAHAFIDSYYDDESDGAQDMGDYSGDPGWREKAHADVKYGTVGSYAWTWWQDPWAPVNAGSDAFTFYDAQGEVIDEPTADMIEAVESL